MCTYRKEGEDMCKDLQLNHDAITDLAEACDAAHTFINELLIENAVALEPAREVAAKLFAALKKAGVQPWADMEPLPETEDNDW